MSKKYSGKASLQPATLKKKQNWKEQGAGQQEMLRKFLFPITIYHILKCVDTGWFVFFFWLNHILTQIPQINPINNDKKNLSKPAPCWTTPSVELLLAPRLHMGTF